VTAAPRSRDSETFGELVLRWLLATLFVAAVHGGVALALVHWPKPDSSQGEPTAAVMVELSPLPVAPETPQLDLAVGPQQEQSEQNTPAHIKEEPVEKKKEEPTPELPQIETAAAVLETQAGKIEPEPEPAKQEPEPPKKVEPHKEPQPKQRSQVQVPAAPKPSEAARAKVNAAPALGLSSSISVATWRGTVMAHLNRLKRHPGGGADGTSSVAFTIDRSGHVLSARLIRSSGSAVLDQEAVALAHRASPLPAPPDNMGRRSIVLTVPVHFSR
jgi:protein TonB